MGLFGESASERQSDYIKDWSKYKQLYAGYNSGQLGNMGGIQHLEKKWGYNPGMIQAELGIPTITKTSTLTGDQSKIAKMLYNRFKNWKQPVWDYKNRGKFSPEELAVAENAAQAAGPEGILGKALAGDYINPEVIEDFYKKSMVPKIRESFAGTGMEDSSTRRWKEMDTYAELRYQAMMDAMSGAIQAAPAVSQAMEIARSPETMDYQMWLKDLEIDFTALDKALQYVATPMLAISAFMPEGMASMMPTTGTTNWLGDWVNFNLQALSAWMGGGAKMLGGENDSGGLSAWKMNDQGNVIGQPATTASTPTVWKGINPSTGFTASPLEKEYAQNLMGGKQTTNPYGRYPSGW